MAGLDLTVQFDPPFGLADIESVGFLGYPLVDQSERSFAAVGFFSSTYSLSTDTVLGVDGTQ